MLNEGLLNTFKFIYLHQSVLFSGVTKPKKKKIQRRGMMKTHIIILDEREIDVSFIRYI